MPEEVRPVVADEDEPVIVKTKQFAVKPMTPEEAVLQLELIGHDFFVFRNVESDDVNVVYRRRDGNYGLIEPACRAGHARTDQAPDHARRRGGS